MKPKPEKKTESTPRKTLKPRKGGSVVIHPNQQEEKSNGASDQKSGAARKD